MWSQNRDDCGLKRLVLWVATARSRGRVGGRPKALNPKQQQMAVEMYHLKKHPIKDILETFGISKPALYRYVQAAVKV